MFRNFFLPHPHTHKKAHLISWQALVVYIAIFIFLQFGFGAVSKVKPGVLGIASGVDQQELIQLTNKQREQLGLSDLMEDQRLDNAAYAKAQNMFAENYWAHYSPSGRDPWGFINSAGYKFSYAGENLARNFYTSDEVVKAWMNSPTHRANIVNDHYQNIGIAVVEGVLNGQKTTLVVQEFGSPVDYVASAPKKNIPLQQEIPNNQPETPLLGASAKNKISANLLTDPFFISRSVGMMLIFWLMALLMIDYLVLKRRGVVRLGSHHLPHFAVLSFAASSLVSLHSGGIL